MYDGERRDACGARMVTLEPGTTEPAEGTALVRVGLLGGDGHPSDLPGRVAQALQTRWPAAAWTVTPVRSSGRPDDRAGDTVRPRRLSSALAEARGALVASEVDVVVSISAAPVVLRGRPLESHTSPLHRCAMVADAQDPDVLVERVTAAVTDLLQLDGSDAVDLDLPGRGAPARTGRAVVGSAAAVLRPRTWLSVARALRASRPWLLAIRLSRTLIGASAAALVAVVTPDFWVLADHMGAVRLAIIAVLLLSIGTTVLVVGGNMLERPARASRRLETWTYQLTVWLGVAIGLVTLYAVLLLVAVALTLLVLPPGLVSQSLGHPATVATMVRIAALTSVVSLVGSVFGASLEDDDDIQDAAFGNSDDARYDEPAADVRAG